jgi:uncharacterized protein
MITSLDGYAEAAEGDLGSGPADDQEVHSSWSRSCFRQWADLRALPHPLNRSGTRRGRSVLTRGRAWQVIIGTVVITAALGWFAGQIGFEDGVGIDNELSDALDVIDERFADRTSVLQAVVESTDGSDVRSADGFSLTRDLQTTVSDDPVADTLVDDPPQPPVVSYLGAAEAVVEEEELDPADLDDEDVRELQERGREFLPEEAAAQVDELVADPPEVGLVLFFQDTEGLGEDEELERQRALAEVIEEVDAPDGLTVSPLLLPLLLEDEDTGAEIGRLFATALAIVMLALAIVYWVRPTSGHRARLIRRTAADLGLTLLVIVFAVIWMQGLGVLLGPG